MAKSPDFGHLAVLAGLDPDHPWVHVAHAEYARLLQRLGGEASEREAWLVALCVQRLVELEIARGENSGDITAHEPETG